MTQPSAFWTVAPPTIEPPDPEDEHRKQVAIVVDLTQQLSDARARLTETFRRAMEARRGKI